MKIGLLSDTHSYMDDRIIEHLSDCDEIWHAGDIGSLAVTDRLAGVAKVRAVYGNIDDHVVRTVFPENEIFEVDGLKVWMTHIGGRPGKYAKGISEQMKVVRPKLFICGHSHLLLVANDQRYGCLHMNPGAAGVHGVQQVRTMLRFRIEGGKPCYLEVIELGKRG
jgi:uncharacterized protein